MEARFGLAGVRKVPFPHLTLLAFEELPHPQVNELLARVSQATAPFTLEASGIGVFNDPARILFAPVVQTPGLNLLHRLLYEDLKEMGARISDLYAPGRWVPHITLAQGQGTAATYGEAVAFLLGEHLKLPFEVRNLTLLDWIGPRYEPCERFPLMGR